MSVEEIVALFKKMFKEFTQEDEVLNYQCEVAIETVRDYELSDTKKKEAIMYLMAHNLSTLSSGGEKVISRSFKGMSETYQASQNTGNSYFESSAYGKRYLDLTTLHPTMAGLEIWQ